MATIWLQLDAKINEVEAALKACLENTPAEGLTVRQAHSLAALYEDDGQKASTLARAVGVPATSFTPILDALEGRGLIRREHDTGDRRAIQVWLTALAWGLQGDVELALQTVEKKYGKVLR